MAVYSSSAACNLAVLDSLNEDSIHEMVESWNRFCLASEGLLIGAGNLSFGSEFVSQAQILVKYGLESLVQQHFLRSVEVLYLFSIRGELIAFAFSTKIRKICIVFFKCCKRIGNLFSNKHFWRLRLCLLLRCRKFLRKMERRGFGVILSLTAMLQLLKLMMILWVCMNVWALFDSEHVGYEKIFLCLKI